MKRTRPIHIGTTVVAAVFSVSVLVGVMFFARIWTVAHTYNVSAYVSNARGIAEDSTVFEAGLPVGVVTQIMRHGPDAILSLRLSSGIRPLPVDTKIQLGLRSVAGEADVLLYPGHSKQTVADNGSLQLSRDESYTDVDQILNQFSGSTQQSTRTFLQAGGHALDGEGKHLNNVLGNFAAIVTNSLPLTSTLAAQHEHVAHLVRSFGDIMGEIGQRSEAIHEFAIGSRITFQAVAARDVALRSMLRELPSATSGLKLLGTAFYRTSPIISDDLLVKGTSALHALNPTIHLLGPASQKGIQLLDSLGAASPVLGNVLVRLQKLRPSATAAFPQIHAVTCQLDPMLRYIAPYGPDLAALFEDFGAATDAYAAAHQLLVPAMVDPSHFIRGVDSQGVSTALDTLFNFGIFRKAGAQNGFDPAEGPGGIFNRTKGLGNAGAADFGTNYKYPHVTQDCSR